MAQMTDEIFSAQEAAQELGITDGRIRQICRAADEAYRAKKGQKIGKKIGRDWFLTVSEIEIIRLTVLRNPKNSEV